MARFRDRDGELSALEAALRNGRPQPGAGLERDIAQSVGAPTGRRGARPALALLLTTGAAAAFLSFGGVGYAVDAVNTATGGGSGTASQDEYAGGCVEYVNPHGKVIPPAGLTPPGTNPKGGENPDGFYQVGSLLGETVKSVFLSDGCGDGFSGTAYGTFDGGTVVKYTEANGKDPGFEPMAGNKGQGGGESEAVDFHIWGNGDLLVCSDNERSNCVCCHVPPPPK